MHEPDRQYNCLCDECLEEMADEIFALEERLNVLYDKYSTRSPKSQRDHLNE